MEATRIVKFSASQPKEVAARTFRFVASTSTVDREGDVIDANGWDFSAFQKNPVILACHDYREMPVARASRVAIEGGRLMVDVQFPPEGTTEAADEAYRLVTEGLLRAVSVGFRPLKWEPLEDSAYGVRYLRQELLEVSLVPVPANPEALIAAAFGARARGHRSGEPVLSFRVGDFIAALEVAFARAARKSVAAATPTGARLHAWTRSTATHARVALLRKEGRVISADTAARIRAAIDQMEAAGELLEALLGLDEEGAA